MSLETLNITYKAPDKLKSRIWNDVFIDGHHTHVTSENDKNTIGKEIDTQITPVNLH